MTARVAASESALLSIARALVRQLSADAVAPLLRHAQKVEQLRPTAMRLLKSTLARGVVLELNRRGGWRPMRHLRHGQPVAGRLWERHPALTLHFSPAAFELCRWLAVAPLANARFPALERKSALTVADEVLVYLAADLLVRAGLAHQLMEAPIFRDSPLVWLAFFPLFADVKSVAVPSFSPFLVGDGAVVLEALQWALARNWVAAERDRRQLFSCAAIDRRAAVEEAVLSRFLTEAIAVGRRDLADFVVEAAGVLLARPLSGADWLGPVDRAASLRDRASARRASGVFLRHLATLEREAAMARQTAFFEDDYPAAQAFAARWEVVGDEGASRARAILQDLEAIDFDARHTHPEPAA